VGGFAKSGPATYLTAYEEKELVDFLIACTRIGFARTRMTLVRTAMIKKGNNDAPITNGWWDSFMKRHPQLTLKTGICSWYDGQQGSYQSLF
jgi:hypothetical protein